MNEENIFRLKQFFAARGWSYADVAEKVGTHKNAVSNLMCGRANFGNKMAMAWEGALGISARWLMTGKGNMMADGTPEPPTPTTTPSNIGEALHIIARQQEQIDRLIDILAKHI